MDTLAKRAREGSRNDPRGTAVFDVAPQTGRRKRGVHRSRPDSKLAVQRPICHEISFGETQDERRIGNRRVSVEIPGYKSVGQIIAQGENLGRRRRTQHPRRFELASLAQHSNRARRIGHGGLIRHPARTRPPGCACRIGNTRRFVRVAKKLMRALQCHACASRRFLDWRHCRTCVRTRLSMLSDSRSPTGRVFRSASRAPRRRLQRKREARTETANSPCVQVACIGYHEAAACHSRHVPLTEGRPLANAANHPPRARASYAHADRPASGS